ncbi:MAG: hypothetical protein QM813_19455 [Verrucomicrobiota bacterium]
MIRCAPRSRSIPEDRYLLERWERWFAIRGPRINGKVIDAKIVFSIAGFFDDHTLLLDFGKLNHQVADGATILALDFGDVAFTPFGELQVERTTPLQHRLRGSLNDFKSEVKFCQLRFEVQRKFVVTAVGIRQDFTDIAYSHRATPARRDGKDPGLEMIAPRPLDQSGVNAFAGFLFKYLPAFVLVHYDSIHHGAINIQRVAADRRADRQGKIQIPSQRSILTILKYHGHFGLGNKAMDLHFDIHFGDVQRFGVVVLFDH